MPKQANTLEIFRLFVNDIYNIQFLVAAELIASCRWDANANKPSTGCLPPGVTGTCGCFDQRTR